MKVLKKIIWYCSQIVFPRHHWQVPTSADIVVDYAYTTINTQTSTANFDGSLIYFTGTSGRNKVLRCVSNCNNFLHFKIGVYLKFKLHKSANLFHDGQLIRPPWSSPSSGWPTQWAGSSQAGWLTGPGQTRSPSPTYLSSYPQVTRSPSPTYPSSYPQVTN